MKLQIAKKNLLTVSLDFDCNKIDNAKDFHSIGTATKWESKCIDCRIY